MRKEIEQRLGLKSVGIFLTKGKDSDVAVIRHDSIDDDYHVLPSSTDTDDFDHGVVVLVIPAQDNRFLPFHAHMIWLDIPDAAVRHLSENSPFHVQLFVFGGMTPGPNVMILPPSF